MDRLGWDVWPSGLALGPHGWLQIANFLALGLLLLAFAFGVYRRAGNAKTTIAGGLFALAGVAALLLAFKTDPDDLATWHGVVHYVAYLLFVSSLVLAYLFFWFGVRRDPRWGRTRVFSLYALVLVLPALALPESETYGNYVFFAVILAPLAAFAPRLARVHAVDGPGAIDEEGIRPRENTQRGRSSRLTR